MQKVQTAIDKQVEKIGLENLSLAEFPRQKKGFFLGGFTKNAYICDVNTRRKEYTMKTFLIISLIWVVFCIFVFPHLLPKRERRRYFKEVKELKEKREKRRKEKSTDYVEGFESYY